MTFIKIRHENALELGIPFILSEFGACLETDICAREITQVV